MSGPQEDPLPPDSRSLSPAPPPPPVSPEEDQANLAALLNETPAPRPGDVPSPVVLPHPALLDIANLDSSLKEPYREWEYQLPLEPDSLVPAWWPWEAHEDHRELTEKERRVDFVETLGQMLRYVQGRRQSQKPLPPPPASPTAYDPDSISRLPPVLEALLALRAAIVQDIHRALD